METFKEKQCSYEVNAVSCICQWFGGVSWPSLRRDAGKQPCVGTSVVPSLALDTSAACAVLASLESVTPAAVSPLLLLLHWQGIVWMFCFDHLVPCSWKVWCSINIDNLSVPCVFPVVYLRGYIGFPASASSHLVCWSLGSTAVTEQTAIWGFGS